MFRLIRVVKYQVNKMDGRSSPSPSVSLIIQIFLAKNLSGHSVEQFTETLVVISSNFPSRDDSQGNLKKLCRNKVKTIYFTLLIK